MTAIGDRSNSLELGVAGERPIVIGLVNNMPHRAQESCEHRFRSLFRGGHVGQSVTWRLFDATGQSAAADRRSAYGGLYEDFDALFEAELDAVVVTGAEPQGSTIREEPTWNVVTRIIEWAERRGAAVLWSCLASHAAVSYLDGVERRRRSAKLSGFLACNVAMSDHPLTRGLEAGWLTPHSRWHSLRRQEIEDAGYEVLSTCGSEEIDTFTGGRGGNFLFCQGHPEYETDTLWLEYKRDLMRFITGQCGSPPEFPNNYLTAHTESQIRTVIAGGGGTLEIREGLRRIEAREDFFKTSHKSASARRLLCSNWLRNAVARRPTSRLGDLIEVGQPHSLVMQVSG